MHLRYIEISMRDLLEADWIRFGDMERWFEMRLERAGFDLSKTIWRVDDPGGLRIKFFQEE